MIRGDEKPDVKDFVSHEEDKLTLPDVSPEFDDYVFHSSCGKSSCLPNPSPNGSRYPDR